MTSNFGYDILTHTHSNGIIGGLIFRTLIFSTHANIESYHLSWKRPICRIFNKTQYYQYSNMTTYSTYSTYWWSFEYPNMRHIRHDIFGILEHFKLLQYVEYAEYVAYWSIGFYQILVILAVFVTHDETLWLVRRE